MGGLTSAVHWWEESQMRVLVLCSLVVQFHLLIFTYLRRQAIPGWIKFIMWLAYLGGDAIAIYALATLFNRHKDQDCGGKNTLEVVWAPVLLIHLGGHDGMTAYNIEDNELWTRHLLTAVSQVTVAIYVFSKSWPGGDMRLLQAAIVMFVPGVLKCFAKPWALKKASIKSLVSSRSTQKTTEQMQEDMKRLEEYVQRAKPFVGEEKDGEQTQGQVTMTCAEGHNPIDVPPQQRGSGDIPPNQACPIRRRRQRHALHGKQNKGEMDAFEQYVEGAMAFVKEQNVEVMDHLPSKQGDDIISSSQDHGQVNGDESYLNMILHGEAYKLFVDLSSPYPLRLSIFRSFWRLSEEGVEKAYGSVRLGLANAFILLYTKLKVSGAISKTIKPDLERQSSGSLVLVMWSRMFLPWAAIGLFHHSHREAYSGIDVKITYGLFCCTAALELFSQTFYAQVHDNKEQWPEMVAQYNLTEYFVRNKKHSNKMWIAKKSGCKDFLDQHWSMRSCLSSGTIMELVLRYLKAGWKKKIRDPVTYHKFNDNRGQWALESYEDKLSWSIKGPFDESVVLWHIATDFCFFQSPFSDHIQVCDFAQVPSTMECLLEAAGTIELIPATRMTSGSGKCGHQFAYCKAVQCRQISNYMVYLLFVNPEMLLPGTRRNLFTRAYDELNHILGNNNLNPKSCCHCQQVEEKQLMVTLINIMRDNSNKDDPIIGSQEKSKEGQPINEGSQENFIDDAWDLAQELLKLRDDLGDEKMWDVIQRVWVEMLCFSASRCRGYLHAKALGSGGELLSYVWLLLFYMGMETFTERLLREREEPLSQEANNTTSPSSSSISSFHSCCAASSPSYLHTGGCTSSSHEIQEDNMV